MDPNEESKCELCNVIYTSDQIREDHLNGKKHLLAVQGNNKTKQGQECEIFVRGLPNLVPKEEIESFFQTYGEIVESHFASNNRYCFLEFDRWEPANHLIKLKTVMYKGKRLQILPRVSKINEANTHQPTENIGKIISHLKSLPTFDSQLLWLIKEIQPAHEETRFKVYSLCKHLEWALNQTFACCKIYLFGSTVTNLHLLNSDIDIYVQIPNQNRSSKTFASTTVYKARNILQSYISLFSNVVAIPNAKTPIVKFVHNPTQLKCDINFKNMLGVCNSHLISNYLLMDQKLKPLMILLKFWAKRHDLIGFGGKFSNYTLVLLFIFYMQQSVYSLPPVAVLQTSNSINMQGEWNGGFQQTYIDTKILRIHRFLTILLGFFKFYASFDFSLSVVCPYLGKPIPKTDLLQFETIPEVFQRYKVNIKKGADPIRINSVICVQDPFEQNHNVASAVNAEYLEDFTNLCKVAISIIECSTSPQDVLHKLLTEVPNKCTGTAVANNKQVTFKLTLSRVLVQLNDIVLLKENVHDSKLVEMVRVWEEELSVIVLKFLKDIMVLTVTSNTKDTVDEKSQRLSGQKDVYDLRNFSYLCYGCYNLWSGRKAVVQSINVDQLASEVDQELAFTKYFLENQYKGAVLSEVIIKFSIELKFNESPTEALFILKNEGSKRDYFKTFASHFKKKLPFLVESHLTEVGKSLSKCEKSTLEQKVK